MSDKNQKLHKAGFVSIIGKPNMGKSTLINKFLGKKVSIATFKAQTTRHKIIGIKNTKNYQIILVDTPGIINPLYELHKHMMKSVQDAITGSDLILYLVDIYESNYSIEFLKQYSKIDMSKVIVLINKIDLISDFEQEKDIMNSWQINNPLTKVFTISAMTNKNLNTLKNHVIQSLPFHPPFYPKDILSDRPEKFFVTEIIREQIFLNYRQEIPYGVEVVVTQFRNEEKIIKISTEIFVERDSQKHILIGSGAKSIKKTCTIARLELEKFFNKKVFLATYVKVQKDWRKDPKSISQFGY